MLAIAGAILGNGTEDQVDKLGMYFESIGVAFQVCTSLSLANELPVLSSGCSWLQIIDDVLNLRGFEGNTKKRGEDINAGKVRSNLRFLVHSR